jgi:hypothetical protein
MRIVVDTEAIDDLISIYQWIALVVRPPLGP